MENARTTMKNIGTTCGLNCPFSFNLCYMVEYTYYIYIVPTVYICVYFQSFCSWVVLWT